MEQGRVSAIGGPYDGHDFPVPPIGMKVLKVAKMREDKKDVHTYLWDDFCWGYQFSDVEL